MAALLLQRYSKSCKHIKVSPVWTLISRNRNGASGNLDHFSGRIIQRKLESCSLKSKSGVTLPPETNHELKALYMEVRAFIVLYTNFLNMLLSTVCYELLNSKYEVVNKLFVRHGQSYDSPMIYSLLQLNRPLYPRILGLTRTLHGNQQILNSVGLWRTLGECLLCLKGVFIVSVCSDVKHIA